MRISDWSSDVCSSDLYEYDGIPASGNRYLLTEVLRDKWGFKGFVVTDYTSINEMVPHGYSKDLKQAGEQAINAGVDMDMPGAVYMDNLATSVTEGTVDTKKIAAPETGRAPGRERGGQTGSKWGGPGI